MWFFWCRVRCRDCRASSIGLGALGGSQVLRMYSLGLYYGQSGELGSWGKWHFSLMSLASRAKVV